ncbi:MAG: pentapeptide repeat-containing protein [Planctomycetaceae bacterium]
MSHSPEHNALRRGKDYWNRWIEDFDDFYGLSFDDARLCGRNLAGYNLRLADIRWAHLRKTDLSGADLTEARLWGSRFDNAKLIGTDLSSADASSAVFRSANMQKANLSYADLTDADLRNVSLVDADLTMAILRNTDLTNADLSNARLVGAVLEDADVKNATFTGAELSTPDNEDPQLGQFLELAACKNLATATFSDPCFVPAYLSDAFEYAHRPDLKVAEQCPTFFTSALNKIKALRPVLPDRQPPSDIVDVVRLITTELLAYLKKHPKAMYDIRPRQFEELIAEILLSFGWTVELTPETRDGGYDLFAVCKDISGIESKWIIECKKYAARRTVGVDVVRSLYGVKQMQQGANALLATTSFFSSEAVKYKASRYDLELRDYTGVLEWVDSYQANATGNVLVPNKSLVLPSHLEAQSAKSGKGHPCG